MNTLQVGDTIPKFTAVDQNENSISLSDFKGNKSIVFSILGLTHQDVLLRLVILEIIIKHYKTGVTNCLG